MEDYDVGLRFTEDGTPSKGEPAEEIKIVFNSGKSTTVNYDEETGNYTLFEHGKDYVDGETNEIAQFRNAMMLYMKTQVIDNYGRLKVQSTGEGEGYFACGGVYVPITWER